MTKTDWPDRAAWIESAKTLLAAVGLFAILGWLTGPDHCQDMERIGQQTEVLSGTISRFSDGRSNWRVVVAEVEAEMSELQKSVSDCQCAPPDEGDYDPN